MQTSYVVWAIYLGSLVWMYVDAKKLGVKRGVVKGAFNMGISSWVIGAALFWIIVFPLYLIARPKFKAATLTQTQVTA